MKTLSALQVILCIAAAVAMFSATGGAMAALNHVPFLRKEDEKFDFRALGLGIGFAAMTAAMCVIAAGQVENLAVLWVALIAGHCIMVGTAIWWSETGSEFEEMIYFLGIELISWLTTMGVASQLCDVIDGGWGKFVRILPAIVFIAMIAFMAIAMAKFHVERTEGKTKAGWNTLRWASAVIAGVLILALLLSLVDWSALKKQPEPIVEPPAVTVTEPVKTAPEPEPDPEPVVMWYYHHDDVLWDNYDENGDILEGAELASAKKNDYDFGHNLMQEILQEKVLSGELTYQDILKANTEKDLMDLITVEEAHDKLVQRMAEDPALLGADSFWLYTFKPHRFNGKYLTDYEFKRDEALTLINDQVLSWNENPEQFWTDFEYFVTVLGNANRMYLEYKPDGITDQMYQDGLLGDVPEVIVMKSANRSGWFITYEYEIKGVIVKISYRLDCGGQPCNVAEKANVTVKPNPNVPKTNPGNGGGNSGGTGGGGTGGGTSGGTGGGRSGGGGSGGGGSGGGYVPPVVTDPKNPGKSWVEPNDDPGITGDEFTGDGIGAQFSTKDKNETRSSHAENAAEVIQDIKENLIENPGRAGETGSSNAPSSNVEGIDDIKGNGDSGTGFGGANSETPISEHVTGEETNSSGQTVHDTTPGEVGGTWGGPPLNP